MTTLHFKIRKGLDLPITGSPAQEIESGRPVRRVGVLGCDTLGLKPTTHVAEGDRVHLGQALFSDKRNPGVAFTAPASGVVEAVHRGAKRALVSVVIRVASDPSNDRVAQPLRGASREELRSALGAAGLWASLRTRPFGKVPLLDSDTKAIFVNAMDSNPLSAQPRVILARRTVEFRAGLEALVRMTGGKVYLVTRPGDGIPGTDAPGVTHATFEGPHPSGLVGTHIHFLNPASATDPVWHIGYQDVAEIGHFVNTGVRNPERVIALGGPAAKRPRLLSTLVGADLKDLLEGEVADPAREVRVVSGSVLAGRIANGAATEQEGFLGRYDNQVGLLYEGRGREFLGWHAPGGNKFSIKRVYTSALRPGKSFAFTTNTNGSPRAMVPIGSFEQVMPLDIIPTFLLRSLLVGDTEMAQKLGALELDEEDLGLCTFVCPGKTEYGPLLRRALTTIEKEG
jgi:Na+-transporting NADH:ubiquinone oxidoreductase subunit A